LNGGDSYIAANFQNTGTTGTISDWLLTPPVKLQTGTRLTFYTRTAIGPVIPDRLQVRMSLNGDSTNVGAICVSVNGHWTHYARDMHEPSDCAIRGVSRKSKTSSRSGRVRKTCWMRDRRARTSHLALRDQCT
jgi:hypothetical protein